MSRLDQIVEHLFTHPRAELVLESNNNGFYREPGTPDVSVFRQPLRTGQILLLFADLVPQEQSQHLLAGQAITFRYASPKGSLNVAMDLQGPDIRVSVRAVEPPARSSKSAIESPPPVSRDAPGLALSQLIADLPERRATYLHLAAGQPPFLRVGSSLIPFAETGPFTAAHIREALAAMAPASLREVVMKQPRFDFTCVAKDSVFHVHAQEGRGGGLNVVVRVLPRTVGSLESLGLPPALATGMQGPGLWVLAGSAGHGTTTTLAALAQAVLSSRAASVCMIEAPIEYVLTAGQGLAQQLEVGTHVASFAEALGQARTTDHDLVGVGGLDDATTLAEAIALADRGRLVVGTLHAHSALEATQKLLSLVATATLKSQLVSVLRGVFAQQLVPTLAGGRALAWEVLPGTEPVKEQLRVGTAGLLATSRSHTFEQSLADLATRGEVDTELVLRLADDRAALEALLARSSKARAA
jgi:twitching motility protein PilT